MRHLSLHSVHRGSPRAPGIRPRARDGLTRWVTVTALAACGSGAPNVRVERAVLVPPTGGAPAAIYFTMHNAGLEADTLIGVEVEGMGTATLQTQRQHRAPTAGAGSTYPSMMERVPSVAVAAGGEVRLAPGGLHAVVTPVRRSLLRGDSVRLILRLAGARTTTTIARVTDYTELDFALAPDARSHAPGDAAPVSGAMLYRSNGCVRCHGPRGHGDGPAAATLDPRPRDFRQVTTFRNGSDTTAIAQTLATGIPAGGSMPLYAHLTNSERRAIAGFIIALRHQPADTTIQP